MCVGWLQGGGGREGLIIVCVYSSLSRSVWVNRLRCCCSGVQGGGVPGVGAEGCLGEGEGWGCPETQALKSSITVCMNKNCFS